mgnify:CR=1 FL=1
MASEQDNPINNLDAGGESAFLAWVKQRQARLVRPGEEPGPATPASLTPAWASAKTGSTT